VLGLPTARRSALDTAVVAGSFDMTRWSGFEDPEMSPDQPTWKLRLLALSQKPNTGRWGKYGPFASEKSAMNKASRCRVLARRPEFEHVDVDVHSEGVFVYIRVREPGSNGQ